MERENRYYKENKGDIMWWKYTPGIRGEFIFSFDCKKDFNMFSDYPYKLNHEQKEIFDRENPYWADFFKERTDS